MATPYETKGGRRWRAHWRDDNNVQRSKNGFSSERLARRYEDQKRDEKKAGLLAVRTISEEMTLGQWIAQEWWPLYVAHKPLNTRENYAVQINQFIAPALGNTPMVKLTPGRISKFRDQLQLDNPTLSPKSIILTMRVLSSCLGKAVQRDLLPHGSNPCAGLTRELSDRAAEMAPEPRWALSPYEVELLRIAFLNYPSARGRTPLDNIRQACMVGTMAYSGLRPAEVVFGMRRHVDVPGRQLYIHETFSAEYRDTTKTYKDRFVDLCDPLLDDLQALMDLLPTRPHAHLFAAGQVSRATMHNFRSRPWNQAKRAVLQEHAEEALIRKATPYDLRRSFVSMGARAGVPLADLAAQAGHTVSTLNEFYHFEVRRLRGKPQLPVAEQILEARRELNVAEHFERALAAAGGRRTRRGHLRLVDPGTAAGAA
jgi:integrase